MQSSMATTNARVKPLRFYERLSFEETFWGWIFIVPAVLGLVLFKLGPVLASLFLSFTKYDHQLTQVDWPSQL